MGFFRKSSVPSPEQMQEQVKQSAERTKQALERSTRAKEQADQLGEQLNQIMDRLVEKGVDASRLKWRVRARFRYATTGIEVAHQEAYKAEQQFDQARARLNENFSPRQMIHLTETAETVAAKSEAYLQAVQTALHLWVELEQQTDD